MYVTIFDIRAKLHIWVIKCNDERRLRVTCVYVHNLSVSANVQVCVFVHSIPFHPPVMIAILVSYSLTVD